MANDKANDKSRRAAMIDARRAKVASYKVRGFSLRGMMPELEKDGCLNPKTGKGWSLKALDDDLRFLQETWRATAREDTITLRSRQLAALDEMEREAWQAWKKSIGTVKRTVAERRTGGTVPGDKAVVYTEEEAGDPRYLAIILDCQKRRAAILGTDAPTKIAPTNPDGTAATSGVLLLPAPLTPEQWDQIARDSQAALKSGETAK